MSVTEDLIEFFNKNKQNGEISILLLDEFGSRLEVKLVEDEMIDQRRWVTIHEVVYSIPEERTFVRVREGRGSTENQDDDGIYLVEQVYPQKKVITEYVTKDKIRAE